MNSFSYCCFEKFLFHLQFWKHFLLNTEFRVDKVFLSLNTLKIPCHSFLSCIVSDKKSAIPLNFVPLYVSLESLSIVQQFDYDMLACVVFSCLLLLRYWASWIYGFIVFTILGKWSLVLQICFLFPSFLPFYYVFLTLAVVPQAALFIPFPVFSLCALFLYL